MAARMTKRERVEATMAFQETDRGPLYDLLRNDAAFLGVFSPVPREGHHQRVAIRR